MRETAFDQRVAAVRGFNRFYTRQIGILREGYLASRFSLAEVRVLYELAHRKAPTASELAATLGLDAGYLSRMLASFEKRGLIERNASRSDGRRSHVSLTRRGRAAIGPLEARSQAEVGALLGRLSPMEQERVVGAMRSIERLLGAPSEPGGGYVLRPHQPGDMGWVVHRHGALYAQEYGWDESFEALVASIVAKFIKGYDPKRERCWIAERGGEIVGSVFLVKRSAAVAQLRLMLVEPTARGSGIGARLVDECVRFARRAGYRRITLWTNSVLSAARRIYRAAGFRRVHKERHRSFGHDLVGETWELAL